MGVQTLEDYIFSPGSAAVAPNIVAAAKNLVYFQSECFVLNLENLYPIALSSAEVVIHQTNMRSDQGRARKTVSRSPLQASTE